MGSYKYQFDDFFKSQTLLRDVLQAQSFEVWAQMWTGEQEKQYVGKAKDWSDDRLATP